MKIKACLLERGNHLKIGRHYCEVLNVSRESVDMIRILYKSYNGKRKTKPYMANDLVTVE